MSSFISGMMGNTRIPQEAYNPIEWEENTRSNSKIIREKGKQNKTTTALVGAGYQGDLTWS